VLNDEPSTHPILRELRRLVDAYPGDRMLVGEVWLLLARTHARYYGNGDELHLVFDLPAAVTTPWSADAWRDRIAEVERTHGDRHWPTWVLSNHDGMRHRSRFGSEARARAAAVMLLTLRGTPFLYAGEELGLEDAVVPAERVVDPGGRDGCRAPIPWDAAPSHGWPVAEPWLPWPPEADTRNVAAERADPSSMLHVYRRLLALRKASPALALGACTLLDGPAGTLVYERRGFGERWRVLVNFGDAPIAIASDGRVAVASDGAGEGTRFGGTLAASQAVVLDVRL
jgi:alpha-glucosidase